MRNCLSLLVLVTVNLAGAATAGDFVLTSGDGTARLEFSLQAQMRWDYGYHQEGLRPAGTDNKLYFRRLRPIVLASLDEEKLILKLHLSILPGALELMDLWGEYRFGGWLRLRLGQGKVPFTRHRLNSYTDQTLVDWSGPTRYFGAERQLGVMLHGGPAAPFEYQLGWFTGVNARAANGIGPALIYAEPLGSPSALVDPDASVFKRMHSELVLHLAYNSPGLRSSLPYDESRGGWRWGGGFSLAWDLEPRPGQDFRLRLAPELQLRGWGWGLDAAFYLGLLDLTATAGEYYPGVLGVLVELSYSPQAGLVLACRYANISVRRRVTGDAEKRTELLGREDPSGGYRRGEQQLLLGVAWLLLDHALKLQADLGWQELRFTRATDSGLLARLQIQLAL